MLMKIEPCDWTNKSSDRDFVKLFQRRRSRSVFQQRTSWFDSSNHNPSKGSYAKEDTALDVVINESQAILETGTEGDSRSYSLATWRRATQYLRRLSLHADLKGYELPLPRILPAQDGSIDLLWKSGQRGLLINFPADEVEATYYGRKPGLKTSGVLLTDDAHHDLIRWLVF